MTRTVCRPKAILGFVFDGDDTLWSTEQLYDEARSRARRIVGETGLDEATWEECERIIDVRNVAQWGYTMERFPMSCVQAYEELCRNAERGVDAAMSERIRKIARSVFERDPPLVSGAAETLTLLRAKGARLALLTKGDRELQARRIERSGLRELFDVVRVVPEKSPAIILDVVAALGIDVGAAWMVGNSMRSDVVPAMEAGLKAAWIPAHVWEHERTHDHLAAESAITAARLADNPSSSSHMRWLKVALHPPPEKEQSDTGLRYTDILFGFVIKELFLRLQNWTQLEGAVRWQLVVGTTLVLGSWIGFRRSLHRSRYQLKFFNPPLFQFIVDQLMLILYFRIAVLTDVNGKPAPDVSDLARSTTKLVMYVFVLYLIWDVLGIWMAKTRTTSGDGAQRPLYPDPGKPDQAQKINWVGFSITAASLLLLAVTWLLADCLNPNILFPATTALLLLYRWAKEVRTSCQ